MSNIYPLGTKILVTGRPATFLYANNDTSVVVRFEHEPYYTRVVPARKIQLVKKS